MTETVMEFLTTRRINYTLILFFGIGVYAPFLHLHAGASQEGIFGFSWMSSFLNALALPTMALSSCLVLLVLRTIVHNEYRRTVFFMSMISMGLAVYHYAYVFLPIKKDFPVLAYYILLLVVAIGTVICFKFLTKGMLLAEGKLKRIIRSQFIFMFTETDEKGYVKEEMRDTFETRRNELVDKAVGND